MDEDAVGEILVVVFNGDVEYVSRSGVGQPKNTYGNRLAGFLTGALQTPAHTRDTFGFPCRCDFFPTTGTGKE